MIFMSIIHDIIRNKVQSLIIIMISFLFTCFFGIYLGSISRNNILLHTLGERLPVKAMLVDMLTGEEMGLNIMEKQVENFTQLNIEKITLTAESYGNCGNKNPEKSDKRISLYMNAANDISMFTLSDGKTSMDETEMDRILKSDEALCFLDQDYLEERGVDIGIGDTLDIILFRPIYDDFGFANQFREVGKTEVKVAGLYWGVRDKIEENFPNTICPIKWLANQYKAEGISLTYTSAKGIVSNPLELNSLKENAKNLKFGTQNVDSSQSQKRVALAIDDRMFIQTATQIQQNIRLLEFFKYPVIMILFFLEALISFIVTKKHVYNIYLARCLGEKNSIILTKLMIKMLFLSFIGGIVASILLVGVQFIDWIDSFYILMKFLFVCFIGIIIPGVFYLRMNLLKLFQQIE